MVLFFRKLYKYAIALRGVARNQTFFVENEQTFSAKIKVIKAARSF